VTWTVTLTRTGDDEREVTIRGTDHDRRRAVASAVRTVEDARGAG
jgi:hypothetical protein